MDDDAMLDALGDVLREDTPAEPEAWRVDQLRELAAAAAAGQDDAAAPLGGPAEPAEIAGRSWWPTLAAAAALLAALGFGAFFLAADGEDGEVEYAGAISGPGGDGELDVVKTGIGRVIDLRTDELEILPTGEYYEVWFVSPDDRPDRPDRISAGTFHPDDEGRSNVTFAAAVDPRLYPIVEITAEPGDGDPRATGPVVLSVEIDLDE